MYRWNPDADDALLLMGPQVPWPEPWTPERVIERLEPFSTPERIQRVRRVIENRIGSVTVVLDAPHDPHNGAAVIRSAEAFGIPEVHVVARAESFRVGRTVAKGAQRWVDVLVHATPEEAIQKLRARNFTLVAAHPQGELELLDLLRLRRCALILGNEHDGVCEELERGCEKRVRIPMRGFVESLNVSVAAGVLLAAATNGRAGDLGAEERLLLYAKALFRSVPRATDILAASRASLGPSSESPDGKRELLPRGGRSV